MILQTDTNDVLSRVAVAAQILVGAALGLVTAWLGRRVKDLPHIATDLGTVARESREIRTLVDGAASKQQAEIDMLRRENEFLQTALAHPRSPRATDLDATERSRNMARRLDALEAWVDALERPKGIPPR